MVCLLQLNTSAKRASLRSPVRENRTPGSVRGRPGQPGVLPRYDGIDNVDLFGLCNFKIVVTRLESGPVVGTLSTVKAYCCENEVWSGVGREPPPAVRNGKDYPVKAGTYSASLNPIGTYGPDATKSGKSPVFNLDTNPPGFQAIQMHAIPTPDPYQPDPASPNLVQSVNDIDLSRLKVNSGKGCTWVAKSFELIKADDGQLNLMMRDSQIALRELKEALKSCCPKGGGFPFQYEDKLGQGGIPSSTSPNVKIEDLIRVTLRANHGKSGALDFAIISGLS